jgi:hypothetical protein
MSDKAVLGWRDVAPRSLVDDGAEVNTLTNEYNVDTILSFEIVLRHHASRFAAIHTLAERFVE